LCTLNIRATPQSQAASVLGALGAVSPRALDCGRFAGARVRPRCSRRRWIMVAPGESARFRNATPSEGPSPRRIPSYEPPERRTDGSGQAGSWAVAFDHAHVRLVDLSSQTPSGGGQRADPVQKHDPGERISRKKVKKGIDKSRPVTEAQLEQNRHVLSISQKSA
jgi:hypothetical protein